MKKKHSHKLEKITGNFYQEIKEIRDELRMPIIY